MGLQWDYRRAAAPIIRAAIPDYPPPVIPAFSPVIPAKAGIQTVAAKPAIRNQARIEAGGSHLPLRERAKVRARRALTQLCQNQN